jgi:hypothetical protein
VVIEHRLQLRILGHKLTLGTDDDSMRDALEQLWEPFIDAEGCAGNPTIEVLTAHGWELHVTGSEPKLESGPWRLLIEARNAIVEAAIERTSGILDLHAAVVVRGGSALLLVGAPYAGKTSLALELVKKGWSYFSDDVAPIHVRSKKVVPFPKPLGIKMRTWSDYWAFWKRPPPWVPDEEEAFLVPGPPAPSNVADATIDHIVMLRFQLGAAPELAPLSSGRTAAMCADQVRGLDERKLKAISEICRRADTAFLTYGSVDEAVPLVERLAAADDSNDASLLRRS